MSLSIAGKTAIVTGAANGIGLAIGRHFAEAGANVMFADIDEKRLVEELGEQAEDGNIRYFAGDLREKLTISNLVSATIDAFDQIDILVNGARRFATTDPLDAEDDSVMALLNQNLMSALRLSQHVARRMIEVARGRPEGPLCSIINLGSIAAYRAQPDLLGYSISAAALDQMTRSLAVALAPHRIRVNAVAFGSVMSASLQEALRDNRTWREEIARTTPLGRIADARELVEAARFLASEASCFMTGQILTLDGGRSLLDAVSVPAH